MLCNFYVDITTWYRFVLDTITDGNFLTSHTSDAFKAMENLVGSPPIIINETIVTMEHVMRKLDAIENKITISEQIEELDKNFRIISLNLGHG